MATNQEMIGAQASHAVFLGRLATGNANKVIPFLVQADEYLTKRLAREGDTIRNQTRLLAVQRDVRKKLTAIYKDWELTRDKDIYAVAPMEATFQAGLIEDIVKDFDAAIPPPEQIIRAANSTPLSIGRAGSSVSFSKMLESWTPNQIAITNGVIQNGFALGQTTQEISRRMRNEVIPLSRRDSDSIVRTAISSMSNTAKMQTYAENDDVVIGYRLIATLDVSTTDQCKGWDQTVVLKNDPVKPMPPFHYNCRTVAAPELDGRFSQFDEGATRASKGATGGKQVSSTKQYYDWLNTQSASFQNSALGKERAMIFRNSGLTPQEFRKASVDRMGKPLTIEQMAAKNDEIRGYLAK